MFAFEIAFSLITLFFIGIFLLPLKAGKNCWRGRRSEVFQQSSEGSLLAVG